MIDTVCLENPVFERAALGGSDTREIPIKLGGSDTREIPIKLGGSGKRKTTLPFNAKGRLSLAGLCRKQGLPENFTEHFPFRTDAACKAIGNGVPLPMGRAIARAVKEALEASCT